MPMSITVQSDACVGAGQCALVAPDVFDQDDDGIVLLLEPDPQGSDLEAATRAVRLCPARAISLAP
ncbi:ferredoxin [Microbacterium sp. LWH11-1.2]|uniref:ferredoxin n=2 Tax=Microbacterium sp. LWH11-1.2 TaxID=3135258 RepID=UPI00313A429B